MGRPALLLTGVSDMVACDWRISPSGSLHHDHTGLRISPFEGITFEGCRYGEACKDDEMEIDLDACLGRGSCGRVHMGRLHGRPVAVKELGEHGQFGGNMLANEVRGLIQASGCPNLVQCYGGRVSEGSVQLVLEHMDWGSLADLVAHCPRGAPGLMLAGVARQLLLGLRALHAKGWIHCDVKPGNVLLNARGEVKLADFGVATELDSRGLAEPPHSTALYMAPERHLEEPCSLASDVWSFGVLLHELATGRHPFVDANGRHPSRCSLIMRLTEEAPPRLASSGTSELDRFLDRCLQRRPEDRATVAELLQHPFLSAGAAASAEDLADWLSCLVPDDALDERPSAQSSVPVTFSSLDMPCVSRPRRVACVPEDGPCYDGCGFFRTRSIFRV